MAEPGVAFESAAVCWLKNSVGACCSPGSGALPGTMPYLEDGETWCQDYDVAEVGMAENRPGHKKFASYKLPSWAKHPLTHPFNGVIVTAKDYMYTAGDGFVNPLGWSIAHIACKYGDVPMLEMCTAEELNRPSSMGDRPAHYAVMYGTSWCLQKLVELGADTVSRNNAGDAPEQRIWKTRDLHTSEQEWLFQALKGELSEKNSVKAQEYNLVKRRAMGNDSLVTERLDKNLLKQRKYVFGTGEYVKPYPIPEQLKQRLDLPLSRPKGLPETEAFDFDFSTQRGWDVREICLKGPEEKLSETK
eukprot:Skav202932  [mRNA]  locus=scaffold1565:365828:373071:- [translate_table: standard]